MPLDDHDPKEDPIEGLGEEIVPSRGIPFEDLQTADDSDAFFGEPRDVSPEELEALFAAQDAISIPANRNWLETASGMGAREPIMTEADFVPSDLPSTTSSKFSGATGADAPSVRGEGFVERERMARLWDRIDLAQQNIRTKVPNLALAKELTERLETARTETVGGIDRYEESERIISEVELRIAVIERAKADSGAALALFLYELVWGIGLVTYFISVNGQDLTDQIILAHSAAWGGLGGIAGALFALWKHVSRDVDFSRQYALWYITSPFTGLLIGAFVFLVIKFGLLSLFSGATDLEISSPFVIYILAIVVGYQQNAAWSPMRRVLNVFRLTKHEDPGKE